MLSKAAHAVICRVGCWHDLQAWPSCSVAYTAVNSEVETQESSAAGYIRLFRLLIDMCQTSVMFWHFAA
jgi:hypothetical protein